MTHVIKTPLTDPEHHTVGRYFASGSHPGVIWYCDSWDSRWGYWMRDVESSPVFEQDQESQYRRNISERAVGATWWRIRVDPHFSGDRPWVTTGLRGWTGRDKFWELVERGLITLREEEKKHDQADQ